MTNTHELVSKVNFDSTFDKHHLRFNEELGFLEISEAEVAAAGIRLVGFSLPLSREGGINNADIVRPLTHLWQLPLENRTIDEQGKGVGPRLYNSLQALGGSRVRPDNVGLYTVNIYPDRILDLRANQGNRLKQIARHAGRVARSKLTSIEEVVNDIHASYGDADAVELTMPPHPELRQLQHGVKNPVKPQFIIIRNPNILMQRVGTAPAPW